MVRAHGDGGGPAGGGGQRGPPKLSRCGGWAGLQEGCAGPGGGCSPCCIAVRVSVTGRARKCVKRRGGIVGQAAADVLGWRCMS
eukprot:2982977-Pyramimonas_sp.AAC.1